MIKWTYVVLWFVLHAAMLPIFAIVFFALSSGVWGGLAAGSAIVAWFVILTVEFVYSEVLGRRFVSWWRHRGGPPYRGKLLWLLVQYFIVGWFIYQAIVSPDEFHLPFERTN